MQIILINNLLKHCNHCKYNISNNIWFFYGLLNSICKYFVEDFYVYIQRCAVYLVTQSCPTLWDSMGYSLPGSSVHGDSPGKNTGVGCHALLQGIFPTQGTNPGLPHCRLFFTNWATREAREYWSGGSLSLLQGILPTQKSNWDLLHCRWILY